MSIFESRRRERIRGNPGVWATRQDDGRWTIYTVVGIYKIDVEDKSVNNVLAQVKLVDKGVRGTA